MPNGPHSHQWSTPATSTVTGSRVRSLPVVQAAVEQLDLLGFPAEHVHQAQPVRVTVLEVGQLVGEHHRVVAPVAVQQRYLGLAVRGQHRGGDRQHRGDPAARRDQHVLARRGQVRHERARRRLHLEHVAGPDLVHQPPGHRAAGHLADPDARAAGPRPRRSSRTAARRRAARSATGPARTRTGPPARVGTSNVTAAESSVSGSTRPTVSGWNSVRDPAAPLITAP